MASSPTKSSGGSLDFQLNHVGNIINIVLTLPVATTYESVRVYTTDQVIPVKTTIDLKSANLTQKVDPKNMSDGLTLSLKNIKTTKANEDVVVWMVFPVASETSKYLKVRVKDIDDNVYVADIYTSSNNLAAVNFNRGKVRNLKASPVLGNGVQSGIEDWEVDEEIFGEAD